MAWVRQAPWLRWCALLVGWLITRALLVSVGTWDLPFYPDGPLAFDDLDVYAGWLPMLNDGTLPVDDMWQYPPFSGLFFLVGNVGAHPQVALMAAILEFDLALTVVLGRHRLAAGWWWVLFGLLIGPVLVSRFDVVPTLFAVLAVLAAARPLRAGIWAAVGAGLKVWPVLVLAVVPRRRALPAAGGFLATSAAMIIVTALVFEGLSGFLGGQGSRGLQVESVGALPFLIINAAVGGVDLEYRYGSMEVAQDGAGLAAAIVTIVALVGFVIIAVSWWTGRLARSTPPDIAFTVVLFSVVISRVFSPQYSIWMLGLGALCMTDPASRLRAPVGLVAAAAAVTQVLYPWGYGWLLAGERGLVALQAMRILFVVVACGWSLWRVLAAPPQQPVAASPAPATT